LEGKGCWRNCGRGAMDRRIVSATGSTKRKGEGGRPGRTENSEGEPGGRHNWPSNEKFSKKKKKPITHTPHKKTPKTVGVTQGETRGGQPNGGTSSKTQRRKPKRSVFCFIRTTQETGAGGTNVLRGESED